MNALEKWHAQRKLHSVHARARHRKRQVRKLRAGSDAARIGYVDQQL
jgi:late competence protein required for DNA uptake (superfamily II DNA/RNA helicase)